MSVAAAVDAGRSTGFLDASSMQFGFFGLICRKCLYLFLLVLPSLGDCARVIYLFS